jgi:outer membrane protein assembly factor BamD (BamD/ComL family)
MILPPGKRILVVLGCVLVLTGMPAAEESATLAPPEAAPGLEVTPGPAGPPTATRQAQRQLLAGEQAVRRGLAGLAVEQLRPLLDREDLAVEERQRALDALLGALLQRDQPDEAIDLIWRYGRRDDMGVRLRWALAEFLEDDFPTASILEGRIEPARLSAEERPWLFLLRGLLAEAEGESERSVAAFRAAREAAGDQPLLLDTIDALRARLQFLRGEVDEATVLDLRDRYAKALEPELRLQLAREYALALAGRGRTADAREVLDQLRRESAAGSAAIADRILLPLAVFTGLDQSASRPVLRELLRNGTDATTLRAALRLYLRGTEESPAEGAAQLAALLEERPAHPIRDRLLLSQGELLARAGATAEARATLERFFEDYPGSPLRDEARLAQALLAWQGEPPGYRQAASLLIRIIPELPFEARPFYQQLAGDLFFANGDYESAAAAYQEAWESEADPVLAYQAGLSHLRNGEREKAARWVEPLGDDPLRGDLQWNLARAELRAGEEEEALRSVQQVLAGTELASPQRWRFLWLRAYLRARLGDLPAALAGTRTLREQIETSAVTGGVRASASLRARTLLLEGELLLRTGRIEEGTAVLANLRERFPEENASVLSFLFEARFFAGRDQSSQAQSRLVNLAERFPEHPQAPIALYEAASIAESRGSEEARAEALQMLDDLVRRFPDHPLALPARLRQGRMLRDAGDFPSARLVFRDTASQFPDHPLRYRALMGWAETVLADGQSSPAQLREAAVRFGEIPTFAGVTPATALEACFRQAQALHRAGDAGEARNLLWRELSAQLAGADAEVAADRAFWMSRGLLALAEWRENEGEPEEARRLLEIIERRLLPGHEIATARLRATSGTDAS